jgi:hypothetical protein
VAFVNAAMNLRVHKTGEISWLAISFSRQTLLYRVG